MTEQPNSSYHRNALPAGTILKNDYRIGRVLGHGGFSITYYAQDMHLGKEFAIKEFLPQDYAIRGDNSMVYAKSTRDEASYEWGLDKFMMEAKILASLNHQNIVKLNRWFEANNTAYLVMGYEKGDTLETFLNKDEFRLDENQIRSIFIPVLDGLHSVHEKGLLHLDIKPSNIYLRDLSIPMLIDFGASRFALGKRSDNTKAILSKNFAPYELYTTKAKLGAWSDIYSVGATIYQCMTGKTPVMAEDRAHALLDNDIDPYQSVTKLISGEYTQGLTDLVDAALCFDAKDRPQSIVEFQTMFGLNSQPDPDPEPESRSGSGSGSGSGSKIGPEQSKPLIKIWQSWLNRTGLYILMAGLVLGIVTFSLIQLVDIDRSDTVTNDVTVPDNNKIVKSCEKLAGLQSQEQIANRGIAFKKINGPEAVKACVKALDIYPDNPKYQFLLGRAYDADESYAKAVNYYRKAALQRHSRAQNNLGYLYEKGYGVKKNYTEALNWYSKAAKQGYFKAQFNLAQMYEKGQGIKRDVVQALLWYRDAANQGNASLQAYVGLMYKNGRGIEQNYTQAVSWFRKAADKHNVIAQFNLGMMYSKGYGVERDDGEAVKWFKKAANQGDANAQYNLGVKYSVGDGVKQNFEKAEEWFNKAAKQKYKEACYNLGVLYQEGLGVQRNINRAIESFRCAADQGDKKAMAKLKQLEK